MKWLENICNIKNGIILNQANYSFDLSLPDIYLPLLTRSKHYILERNTQKDYVTLFRMLKKSNSNLAVFTPSFLDLLLIDKSFDEKLMPKLNMILLCGEKLTKSTVDNVLKRFQHINLYNLYGPTECTFAVTGIKIENSDDISIGKPKDDTKIYIVDDNIQEVKEGNIGEILVTGKSVAKGYLNSNDNFIIYKNEKGFLTGDLGYKKEDKFYCIGRKDNQIKYKGYRIELSEIENVFYNFGYFDKIVVTTRKTENGRVKKILAFLKLKGSLNIQLEEIKERLKNILPEYMIPTIKIVQEMPLTENGKIDINKLMEK